MKVESMQQLSDSEMTQQQRRGRMAFLLLAVFFSVPLLVVMLMVKFDWRPTGKSHGHLVQPPISVTHLDHWVSDQQQPQVTFWRDKWNMVLLSDRCEADCMQRLYDMRQIYVSLYKDMIRVQRVLITQQADTSEIRARYPDMLIIKGEATQIQGLQSMLTQAGLQTESQLFFVDPLGNLMMHYPQDIAAKWVRKDLIKLLKSSWAG